jgi:hypothetical protein
MTFRRKDATGVHDVEGSAVPLFFDMKLRRGWIEVPRDLYRAVQAMENRDAA